MSVRLTIVGRDGARASFEADQELVLGGDPDGEGIAPGRDGAWNGWLRLGREGWVLTVSGPPCVCNGTVIVGSISVREGDVIEVGAVTIDLDRLRPPAPTTTPLSDTERALLARIGDDPSDDHARRVLADHWQDDFDVARGELVRFQCEGVDASPLIAANRQRWLRTAEVVGFSGAALQFARGFAHAALVVEDGESLAGCPDGWRLSPRQYHVVGCIRQDAHRRVFEATARTAAGGVRGRYVLKCPQPSDLDFDTMQREFAILSRLDHPGVTKAVGLALVRPEAVALVLPWAGSPLRELIERVGEPREPLAISIGLALCDVLAEIHRHDILHLGIEPDHVLIAEDGRVTLVGFGAAIAPGLALPPRDRRWRWRPNVHYMSHEQRVGLALGPPSDVFSLALVIAAVVGGRNPIERRIRHEVDVRHRTVSDGLATLVTRAALDAREARGAIGPSDINFTYRLPLDTRLAELLRRTIVPDPDRRPSLAAFADELTRLRPTSVS